MTRFKPKYITFDCYGTLTRFRMGDMARELFSDRVPAGQMEQFVKDFAAYRLDEVLGAWKPYQDVVKNAVRRTLKRWGIEYKTDTWGRTLRKALAHIGNLAREAPAGATVSEIIREMS